MRKTTITTREYDAEGRLVKEIVTEDDATPNTHVSMTGAVATRLAQGNTFVKTGN